MAYKAALKECVVFQSLTEADLGRMEDMCALQDYAAGTTVFSEGASSDRMYILQSGKVALQMQLPAAGPQPGRRISVDFVSKNEVFGWSALVMPRRYTLTAVCLEPTKVLGIDGTRLRALLEEDNRIASQVFRRLTDMVASRLEETRRVLVSERLGSMQA